MIVGLDIGGSKIEMAVFEQLPNQQLQHKDSWRVATPANDYDAFIDSLGQLVERADRKYGVKCQVGIGLPGIVDEQGLSLCANVPCANGKNIAAQLRIRLNRAITIENDCRCFALSEAVDGAGAGYKNIYGAVIGTGAAGGLVVSGQLYKSRQGIAGEYGHLQIPATLQQKYLLPNRPCGCGLPNCFEGFIGGPGLVMLNQFFGGFCDTVPQVLESLRAGNAVACKTFDCYLDILGASFATLILSYDPDIIVLGGGLSLIDEIVASLPAAITPHLFENFTAPPIVQAKFGDASGVRGAAILAVHTQAQEQ